MELMEQSPSLPPKDIQTATPPTPTPSKPKNWPLIVVFIFSLLLFGVVLFLAWQNYQLRKQIIPVQPTPTPIISPLPTTNPTANWKTYRNEAIEFKYPEYLEQGSLQISGSSNLQEFVDKDNKVALTFISAGNYNQLTGKPYNSLEDRCGMPCSNLFTIRVDGVDAADRGNSAYFFSHHKELIYEFVLEEDTESSRQLLRQILSTFKFLDGQTDETPDWKTYRTDVFEFKYPEKNRFEPSREVGDTTPIFCYLLEEGATPKSIEGTACIWTGYISQDQLNAMGITYCGAHPEDPRCESFMINQHLGFTIDWGLEVPGTSQMKASAWISHPEGGVVTLELQPVVPKSKDLFKQILSTFKFLD